MRLRNDPKAKEFLLKHQDIYIDFNPELQSNFNHKTLFDNNHDTYLEIGMGKGQFIIQQALNHPHLNFIGLEVNEVICSKAVKKYLNLESKPSNLKFIKANAKNLNIMFRDQSLNKIFLNFSDPWPKKRHAKNRLTSPNFLIIYKQILKLGSQIEFKSDNDALYLYTLETLQNDSNAIIEYYTNDLYKNLDLVINMHNIATEYEQKFSVIKNINKIVFSFSAKNNDK